ncbi:MAG: hypothetical protein RSB77_06655 [Bacilli bacterium]
MFIYFNDRSDNIKKIFIVVISIISAFSLTGCGEKTEKQVLDEISNKIDNLNSYHLKGSMKMMNNETNYEYSVDVSYKKKNFYRVSLKNKNNDHEQIILKNNDGVFVITPSLNKSFKFQSDWPYNNSQSYLLHNIINDLKNEEKIKFNENEKEYIYESKVNYLNNSTLKTQKVLFNKKGKMKKVTVYNEEGLVKIVVDFEKIDYNSKFNDKFFSLDENISVDASTKEETEKTNKTIDEIIYPMYVPKNTKLSTQDKLKTKNGERVILNFDGDNPFTFIQEATTNKNDNNVTSDGMPIQVGDVIGIMNDYSITWSSKGIDYYIISDNIEDEIINVALSINERAIIK